MLYKTVQLFDLAEMSSKQPTLDTLTSLPGIGTMDELEIPTSWPLPPTSPTQAVTSLQRQLKSLRTDISELLAQAQAATDRTARALQSLRSQDVKGPASSDEPGSQETEPSLTLRDHPFARFSYQNNAQAHPLASASDAGQISNNTEQAAFLTLNLAESPIEERGRTAKVYGSGSVPAIAKIPLHTTYEQSRIFLEVTAAVKDEKTRSVQCGVVEVSCCDPTTLSSRLIANTLTFIAEWTEEVCKTHSSDHRNDICRRVLIDSPPDRSLPTLSQSRYVAIRF